MNPRNRLSQAARLVIILSAFAAGYLGMSSSVATFLPASFPQGAGEELNDVCPLLNIDPETQVTVDALLAAINQPEPEKTLPELAAESDVLNNQDLSSLTPEDLADPAKQQQLLEQIKQLYGKDWDLSLLELSPQYSTIAPSLTARAPFRLASVEYGGELYPRQNQEVLFFQQHATVGTEKVTVEGGYVALILGEGISNDSLIDRYQHDIPAETELPPVSEQEAIEKLSLPEWSEPKNELRYKKEGGSYHLTRRVEVRPNFSKVTDEAVFEGPRGPMGEAAYVDAKSGEKLRSTEMREFFSADAHVGAGYYYANPTRDCSIRYPSDPKARNNPDPADRSEGRGMEASCRATQQVNGACEPIPVSPPKDDQGQFIITPLENSMVEIAPGFAGQSPTAAFYTTVTDSGLRNATQPTTDNNGVDYNAPQVCNPKPDFAIASHRHALAQTNVYQQLTNASAALTSETGLSWYLQKTKISATVSNLRSQIRAVCGDDHPACAIMPSTPGDPVQLYFDTASGLDNEIVQHEKAHAYMYELNSVLADSQLYEAKVLREGIATYLGLTTTLYEDKTSCTYQPSCSPLSASANTAACNNANRGDQKVRYNPPIDPCLRPTPADLPPIQPDYDQCKQQAEQLRIQREACIAKSQTCQRPSACPGNPQEWQVYETCLRGGQLECPVTQGPIPGFCPSGYAAPQLDMRAWDGMSLTPNSCFQMCRNNQGNPAYFNQNCKWGSDPDFKATVLPGDPLTSPCGQPQFSAEGCAMYAGGRDNYAWQQWQQVYDTCIITSGLDAQSCGNAWLCKEYGVLPNDPNFNETCTSTTSFADATFAGDYAYPLWGMSAPKIPTDPQDLQYELFQTDPDPDVDATKVAGMLMGYDIYLRQNALPKNTPNLMGQRYPNQLYFNALTEAIKNFKEPLLTDDPSYPIIPAFYASVYDELQQRLEEEKTLRTNSGYGMYAHDIPDLERFVDAFKTRVYDIGAGIVVGNSVYQPVENIMPWSQICTAGYIKPNYVFTIPPFGGLSDLAETVTVEFLDPQTVSTNSSNVNAKVIETHTYAVVQRDKGKIESEIRNAFTVNFDGGVDVRITIEDANGKKSSGVLANVRSLLSSQPVILPYFTATSPMQCGLGRVVSRETDPSDPFQSVANEQTPALKAIISSTVGRPVSNVTLVTQPAQNDESLNSSLESFINWYGSDNKVIEDPRTLFAAYDALQNGLFTGATSVTSVTEDKISGRMFAGTEPNGAVFYSDDDGTTWTASQQVPSVRAIASMHYDTNKRALYIGTTPNAAIYRSEDGGDTWISEGSLPRQTVVSALYNDPATGELVATGIIPMFTYQMQNGAWQLNPNSGAPMVNQTAPPATPSKRYIGNPVCENVFKAREADPDLFWDDMVDLKFWGPFYSENPDCFSTQEQERLRQFYQDNPNYIPQRFAANYGTFVSNLFDAVPRSPRQYLINAGVLPPFVWETTDKNTKEIMHNLIEGFMGSVGTMTFAIKNSVSNQVIEQMARDQMLTDARSGIIDVAKAKQYKSAKNDVMDELQLKATEEMQKTGQVTSETAQAIQKTSQDIVFAERTIDAGSGLVAKEIVAAAEQKALREETYRNTAVNPTLTKITSEIDLLRKQLTTDRTLSSRAKDAVNKALLNGSPAAYIQALARRYDIFLKASRKTGKELNRAIDSRNQLEAIANGTIPNSVKQNTLRPHTEKMLGEQMEIAKNKPNFQNRMKAIAELYIAEEVALGNIHQVFNISGDLVRGAKLGTLKEVFRNQGYVVIDAYLKSLNMVTVSEALAAIQKNPNIVLYPKELIERANIFGGYSDSGNYLHGEYIPRGMVIVDSRFKNTISGKVVLAHEMTHALGGNEWNAFVVQMKVLQTLTAQEFAQLIREPLGFKLLDEMGLHYNSAIDVRQAELFLKEMEKMYVQQQKYYFFKTVKRSPLLIP